MTIALHGNLRDFGAGEVFQLIGQQRKTGVLEVRGGQGEVALRFDSGAVVSAAPVGERPDAALVEMVMRCGLVPRDRVAELDRAEAAGADRARRLVEAGALGAQALREVEDLLTRETIFELLLWDDGSFRFVAQPIHHDRPPTSLLGAEQVLMDGLRMVDEWRAFAAELPDDQTVFRRRGSLEEFRHSPAGRSAPSWTHAERIYLLVDGRSHVRRVIDLSRLGRFHAVRTLVHLARSGWIEPVRSRAQATAERDAAPSSAARRAAALAAPLVALALLAGIALGRSAPPEPDLALRGAGIEQARARLDTARLRAQVLAHRLAAGEWPESPEQLAATDGDALTRPERGPYYVGRRAEGPIILAPDPAAVAGSR